MSVKRLCLSIILCELLFPVLPSASAHHQFANQSGQLHNLWAQNLEHDEDFVGYMVNKKKKSAKESRFIKLDYLNQNINVSVDGRSFG